MSPIKKVSLLCLIIIFSASQLVIPEQKYIHPQCLAQRNCIIFGIITLGVLCFTAKELYNYYYDYLWPHTDAIAYCRKLYKNMYPLPTNLNVDFYQSLLTADDENLINTIIKNFSTNEYPFVACHTQLNHTLSTLQNHISCITTELTRINKRTTLLQKNDLTPEIICLLNTFAEIETEGKELINYLMNIIDHLKIAKKRISSLEIYKNEYDEWLEEKLEKERIERNREYSSTSIETNSFTNKKDEKPWKELNKLMHAAWDN